MIRMVEPINDMLGRVWMRRKINIEFPQIMKGRLLGRLSHRKEDNIKRVLKNVV
jgi:hypothetical protein